MSWTDLYAQDGVIVGRVAPNDSETPVWFVVADVNFEQFKVTFYPRDDGTVGASLDAQWSEKHPGQLANYTSEIYGYCQPGELSIGEDGLLTALARPMTSPLVDFRSGFTVQLPQAFVPAIRLAIEAAFAERQVTPQSNASCKGSNSNV